ncbi:MAG TPA: phospholipase D-like domain-containing protein, partial [Steroidobacteraceae bacterium]|nr:phospholipase D-like domain-containing protein [Steroidobacteraceae bacterium]
DQIFPAMLQAIAAATERVDFCTYVYWEGNIARAFAAQLAKRARAGVKVRVLLDAFGAKRMAAELVDTMRAAGVEVRWFRPLSTWRVWRSDKRTHRKLLICDDDVGFTGGVGIATEWEGDARNPDEWRDTQVEIRGPAVRGLMAAFFDNWNEAGEWQFEERLAQPRQHTANDHIQIVRASTTVGWTNIATLTRALVALSRRSIRITTAYFCPDDAIVRLLLDAHDRGVDVQLLLSGQHTDSRLSQLAGHPTVQRLLTAGIGVWRYQRTMLHAKLMTVDGQLACVGSANLNHRSLSKDEECTAVIASARVASELDQRFAADKQAAERLTPDRWRQRSLWLRLQERAARLLIEQL